MRHDHAGDVQAADGGIDQLLIVHVQVADCFIKEQQLGLPVQGARKDDALLLPAGQRAAHVADQTVVAHRHGSNIVMHRRQPRRLLDALFSPGEQEDMFATVAWLARGLGFEHCAYGMRAPFALAQQEIVMLNDYSPVWQQRYQDNAYLTIDPTVQRGAAPLDAFVWSNTGDACNATAGFWEDARHHGISCGVSLPALAANSVRGILSVSRGGEALGEAEIRANWPKLVWLGEVAHHGLTRQVLRRWRAGADEELSGREKEMLRWVAEGLTDRQIAERTGITERTVNFHLNNAMGKLKVGNRTAAVRAVALGLLA